MHGQSGQATVEWVALVLLAALALGAAAAFAERVRDRGLGELVAKRVARAPREAGLVAAAARAPGVPVALATAPHSPAPAAPPAAPPGRIDASPAIRGIGTVAKRAPIGCLGYKRWRYERERPLAAIEGIPLGDALGIANDCLNPYDYLFGD